MNLPSPPSSSSSQSCSVGKKIKHSPSGDDHHHHHHNQHRLCSDKEEPPTTAGETNGDLASPQPGQWSQDELVSNHTEGEDTSTLSIATRQGLNHSQLDATDSDDFDEDDDQPADRLTVNGDNAAGSVRKSPLFSRTSAGAFQSLSQLASAGEIISSSEETRITGRKKRRLDSFLKSAQFNSANEQPLHNDVRPDSSQSSSTQSSAANFGSEEDDGQQRGRRINCAISDHSSSILSKQSQSSADVSLPDLSQPSYGQPPPPLPPPPPTSSSSSSSLSGHLHHHHHPHHHHPLLGPPPTYNSHEHHQSMEPQFEPEYPPRPNSSNHNNNNNRLYQQSLEEYHRHSQSNGPANMYASSATAVAGAGGFPGMTQSPYPPPLKPHPSAFVTPGAAAMYRLQPHNALGDLFPRGGGGGGGLSSSSNARGVIAGGEVSTGSESGVVQTAPNSQEMLTLYQNASEAPSRLPAHKPVRLKQPKHPSAPQGTPVYFKYGEEHYPEETVPDAYTFTESDGTICRYITNFLVYNKRGERLLPIEVLDQPRHGALVLYGSLLPAAAMGLQIMNNTGGGGGSSDGSLISSETGTSRSNCGRGRGERRKSSSRRRGEEDCPGHPPYPIRVELAEWCIDYGQEPHNIPFIWLISRWDVYYRLEKPAGRYIPTFSTAKMKFEVSTRIIKTLQWRPDFPYRELVDLLTAATRHERQRKRLEEERRKRRERNRKQQQHLKCSMNPNSADDGVSDDDLAFGCQDDGCNGEPYNSSNNSNFGRQSKKSSRPNWKGNNSLSTPEGTGVVIHTPDGHPGPLTPWKAPFAVENVRESTLLGLTDFLESQMRNFLDGVGGVGGTCANLVETRFMQTLREKASIRRETMQLVETKKRTIESMAAVNGFSHLGAGSPFDLGSVGSPPLVALQVLQPIPMRQTLPNNAQVVQGCAMASPLVTVGFTGETNNPHHHQAMMILKTRQQEEQELNQLLHLLKEFSDPEEGPLTNCSLDNGEDDSSDDTFGPNELDERE